MLLDSRTPVLSKSRVAVTGAAGFIGAALTGRLVLDHGCSVVGIDNERSGDWNRLEVPVDRHHISIEALSAAEWAQILEGSEYVFHLAAEKYNSSKSTPERVLETNIDATLRLLQGAADAGVRKIVFTSSLYAYGSMGPQPMSEANPLAPTTTYGASKAMGEHLLRVAERDAGIGWAVARLFFIYGPNQYAEGGYKSVILSNFERIAAGDPPTIYGDGEQALDYVYIDDCVDALVALASPAGDGLTANVSAGAAVTVSELTRVMLSVSGASLEPLHLDEDWTAGSVRTGTNSRIADAVGWEPSTSLEEGLSRVWSWMSEGGSR